MRVILRFDPIFHLRCSSKFRVEWPKWSCVYVLRWFVLARNTPQLSVFHRFQKNSLSQSKPLNNCVLIGTLMFPSISHPHYVFVMTLLIDNDNMLLRRFTYLLWCYWFILITTSNPSGRNEYYLTYILHNKLKIANKH